ncbi:hypothetical protein FB45DRAFT_904601 [Roridomyces roridus]|uniref:Uncharacterized protein n=1 Tax=Roridomyces roridus TaxID=1738132 RepID=A0AAD7C517_9AGAR|nr:hypothetical protein FB45DRAFT_904601 [Roridomyces roridus]
MLPSSSKFNSFSFPASQSSQPEPETAAHSQSDDLPSDQPAVADLAALGIKVRDFAYESRLPPVRPFRVRPLPVRQQVQPGASISQPASSRRPLKRTRPDGTEVEDLGYGFVMGVARAGPPPRKLQRTETGLGSSQMSAAEEAELRAACDAFGSQPQGYSQQSQGYYSHESSQANSQETDIEPLPFIKTPFITPNGSLQWHDEDERPRPTSPPLVPTEPASLDTSTARVTSHLRSPPPPLQLDLEATPPSPRPLPFTTMETLPASPSPPRTLLRTFSSLSTLSSPLSEPSPSAPGSVIIPPPAPAPSPAPRYELRKRMVPPASPTKRRGRPTPRREDSLNAVIIHS